MTEPDLTLHPEFEEPFGQRGGLLDVPASSDLNLNVGRLCVGAGSEFLMNNELVTVTAVQRLYDGTLGYRVSRGAGDFGRVARSEEVVWFSAGEPVFVLTYFSEYDDEEQAIRVPESRLAAAEDCLKHLEWPLLSRQKV